MNGHFLCAGDFQTTVPILSVMSGTPEREIWSPTKCGCSCSC